MLSGLVQVGGIGIPIAGVKTLSTEEPFRHYQGVSDYSQWLFTYIDLALPDPSWRTSHNAVEVALSSIRAELATLIVSFPIFLILWHVLRRDVRQHPEKARGPVRRGAVTERPGVARVVAVGGS